jgi:hypothetical protein
MSDDIRERVFQFGLRCIVDAARERHALGHRVPVYSWAHDEGFILLKYTPTHKEAVELSHEILKLLDEEEIQT